MVVRLGVDDRLLRNKCNKGGRAVLCACVQHPCGCVDIVRKSNVVWVTRLVCHNIIQGVLCTHTQTGIPTPSGSHVVHGWRWLMVSVLGRESLSTRLDDQLDAGWRYLYMDISGAICAYEMCVCVRDRESIHVFAHSSVSTTPPPTCRFWW
jgi:hypothetical protein